MMTALESALYSVYGVNDPEQLHRYTIALAAFRKTFGEGGPIHVVRAPGRVNLIGEHTDYNHGYVMPVALDKDVVIVARTRSDGMIHLHNIEEGFAPVIFPVASTVPPAPVGDWGNYLRGAVQVFSQYMGTTPSGMDLLAVGAPPQGVPRGAGLSSSTAFTVALASTLCLLAGWHIAPEQLIQLCSDSEWYIGTRGGIMDQFASLFGERGHALFLDCRPMANQNFRHQSLPLPAACQLLIVDSGVHHNNARGEFNQRVAACRAGVGLLQRQYPHMTHLRDVQSVAWEELEPLLPLESNADHLQSEGISLGELPGLDVHAPLYVRACCRHIWTENQRVIYASDTLESKNVTALGQLLNAAHISARDDYRISCPEIEVLVQSAQEVDGAYGARLTGAGWGGCMIALVHQDAVADFQAHVTARYTATTGQVPAIFPCRAGPGAGLVGQF
ncbi:MAG: galactokinase [Caldilineaceae bacterium]|nr:galactokinase [Caldilineaceae bacterium]